MKINEIISAPVLYHFTFVPGLRGILRSGGIIPSNEKIAHGWGWGGAGDHGFISLTRDRELWANDTEIRITIKLDALRQTHKITQFALTPNTRKRGIGDESEERVDKPIPFTNKYIKLVEAQTPVSRAILKRLKDLGIPFAYIQF